jgi:hypothetical protein
VFADLASNLRSIEIAKAFQHTRLRHEKGRNRKIEAEHEKATHPTAGDSWDAHSDLF